MVTFNNTELKNAIDALKESQPNVSDKNHEKFYNFMLERDEKRGKKGKKSTQSQPGVKIKKGAVEFNKLPSKSSTPTMTYAGIGSRATPQAELEAMTEAAKMLSEKGYTLRSGGAKGADTAFEKFTNKK